MLELGMEEVTTDGLSWLRERAQPCSLSLVALLAFLLGMISAGAPAKAQIVAPAGRTLFNEGVLVRSLIRLDTFEESQNGERLRRLRNTYGISYWFDPSYNCNVWRF